jgi:hypothetical protein
LLIYQHLKAEHPRSAQLDEVEKDTPLPLSAAGMWYGPQPAF